jgi:hypothetical protein
MTWKGIVGQRFTAAEFATYVETLAFPGWRPSLIVVVSRRLLSRCPPPTLRIKLALPAQSLSAAYVDVPINVCVPTRAMRLPLPGFVCHGAAARYAMPATPISSRVLLIVGVSFRAVSLRRLVRPAARSSLLGTVAHVVGLRAEEQMRRVHAGRVIARVTEKESVRHDSVVEFPRNPMRVGKALTSPPALNRAITTNSGARPEPAVLSLFNLRPEAFGECFHREYNTAGSDE